MMNYATNTPRSNEIIHIEGNSPVIEINNDGVASSF